MNEKPILMTVAEVGRILRVHRPKVYDMVKAGELEGFKVGNDWRVRTRSVESITGELPLSVFKVRERKA